MNETTDSTACVGCGASVPAGDYPGFRPEKYPGATSPGCYQVYCEEILVREYGEWEYPAIHRLTVDAYMAQHPGEETPQTTQSVVVHLVGIDLFLHHGLDASTVTARLDGLVSAHADEFSWLEPPESRGDVTVVDVAGADTLDEHASLVREWAASIWDAWAEHHEEVERWTEHALDV